MLLPSSFIWQRNFNQVHEFLSIKFICLNERLHYTLYILHYNVGKNDALLLREIRLYELLSIGLDRIMVGKNIVVLKNTRGSNIYHDDTLIPRAIRTRKSTRASTLNKNKSAGGKIKLRMPLPAPYTIPKKYNT